MQPDIRTDAEALVVDGIPPSLLLQVVGLVEASTSRKKKSTSSETHVDAKQK